MRWLHATLSRHPYVDIIKRSDWIRSGIRLDGLPNLLFHVMCLFSVVDGCFFSPHCAALICLLGAQPVLAPQSQCAVNTLALTS